MLEKFHLFTNILSGACGVILLGSWLWTLLERSSAPVLYSGATGLFLFSFVAAALLLTGWIVYFGIAYFAHWEFVANLLGFYVLLLSVVLVGGFFGFYNLTR